jgi:hypothetical protein
VAVSRQSAAFFKFPAFCRKPLRVVAMKQQSSYIARVIRLTKQEQLVLCVVLGLLLTGWAVKIYRTAHPETATSQTAKP